MYLHDRALADHPARAVDAVVDSLDISGIERGYKCGETSSYESRAMLKVVFLINLISSPLRCKV